MKNINFKNIFVYTSIIFSVGCVSFKDPHQRFIDELNLEVSLKQTIKQMDYDALYPLGRYNADYRDLTTKEVRADGFLVYHYAKRMLTGEYICHYHLLVDPKTDLVVGWDFDRELGDPQKNCRIAG